MWENFRSKIEKKHIIIALLLFLIFIFGLKFSKNQNKPVNIIEEKKQAKILVKKFILKQENAIIKLSGNIIPKNVNTIIPQTDGIVKEIKALQGQKIKKNDTILLIDEKDKLVEFNRAEQFLKQKKLEYEISSKLLKTGDVAVISNIQAQTAYNEALSQFSRAKNNLKFTKVHATISGYIDTINVKKGDYINQTTEIAQIFSDKRFIVITSIPQTKVHDVKTGQKVIAELNGRVLSGIVDFVSNIADKNTKTYYCEIKLDAEDFLTKMINAPVNIEIIYDTAPSLILPDNAISINDNGRLSIKILNKDDKIELIPIEIISSNKSDNQLSSKVFQQLWANGDKEIKVIIRGGGFFKDGEDVKNIEYIE